LSDFFVVIPELDDPVVCANPSSWPLSEAAIQEDTRYFSLLLEAGSSPAMTVERKSANVFMASSASGNIRVIKSRERSSLYPGS
jgi:hypothetical protein